MKENVWQRNDTMKRDCKLLMILCVLLLVLLSLTSCMGKKDAAQAVLNPTEAEDVSSDTNITPTLLSKAEAPTKAAYAPTPATRSKEKEKNTSKSNITPTPKADKDQKKETKSNKNDKTDKRMIAIDAGHQSKGNNKTEPIGPGSATKKAKVSSGTHGVATGVPEYKLTLAIALKVKEELINRGYDVFMIRETHDVNLSNKERAEMANESGADLFIRIHADGIENSSVSGTSTLYPSEDNLYVSELSEDSYALSKAIVDAMCKRTKAKNRGAIARDDMSGINWCSLPVSIIEMGFMSNKKEDRLMQTEEYQDKLAKGICDGIDDYYD
jgi:N-acetylmuramoyl-L-alanine amidase